MAATLQDNLTLVSVETASDIVLNSSRDFGTEEISLDDALGRVLAEDVIADTDYPAFDRITMDGIAIRYESFENGLREFTVTGRQAAGENPLRILSNVECIEVMTGSALSESADTIVRYEDVEINGSTATIHSENIRKHQNIHRKGIDKKRGEVIADSNQFITPATVAVLASSGYRTVKVKRLPRVKIISTGNEIIEADKVPEQYQIRNSNRHVLTAILLEFGVEADFFHLPDDKIIIEKNLKESLDEYDVIILTGGVSKGKFDFIPDILDKLGVKKNFHQVLQRPGKPFWFGERNEKIIFALPGNANSVFLCSYRYIVPWLKKSLGLAEEMISAKLMDGIKFLPSLQMFLPVKLKINNGSIEAWPVSTNGSGDFINLLQADAFMELPAEKDVFNSGEVYRVWPFKKII